MAMISLRGFSALSIAVSLTVSCGEDKAATPADKTKVALYAGRGACEWCKTAAESMFEWMGYEVERISPEFINASSLDGFDLICFPGGDMYEYSQDISSEGKIKIKQFISAGGGYFGICGGAYFAAEEVYWRGGRLDMRPLSLYSGTAAGPVDQIVAYPDYGMCALDVATLGHPITAGEDGSMSVLYYWGPYLAPDAGFEGDVICDYHITATHAMLAFEYGEGRVFLTGVHPEVEENDDRDGTDAGDDLTDPETDWDFMKKAARWCLGEI
ncbi:MAG: hypothetical protein EHM12_07245 [Dehalococcoidia bacterium]|nr:MAG: hypothetical protein EHM12_07245 [Dehalococcoidia bacterium]